MLNLVVSWPTVCTITTSNTDKHGTQNDTTDFESFC